MLRIEPHLINFIRHFGKPRVRRSGKGLSTQVQLPQRAQGIDNEHIRVEVQYALKLFRQDERGEQAVVHLLGVALAGRGIFKERRVNGDGTQLRAEESAETRELLQLIAGDGAVEQIYRHVRLIGVAGKERAEHDLAGRQIIFIKSKQ